MILSRGVSICMLPWLGESSLLRPGFYCCRNCWKSFLNLLQSKYLLKVLLKDFGCFHKSLPSLISWHRWWFQQGSPISSRKLATLVSQFLLVIFQLQFQGYREFVLSSFVHFRLRYVCHVEHVQERVQLLLLHHRYELEHIGNYSYQLSSYMGSYQQLHIELRN